LSTTFWTPYPKGLRNVINDFYVKYLAILCQNLSG